MDRNIGYLLTAWNIFQGELDKGEEIEFTVMGFKVVKEDRKAGGYKKGSRH